MIWAGLITLLAMHFYWMAQHHAPAIATPDANGYWAQGSLLVNTGKTYIEPESDLQYIEHHWVENENGRYYSYYPPGLSVLVGVVYKTLGYKASTWINPVLATLTLVGLFLLVRKLINPFWALLATLALAMVPYFNQQALWCFAHMAVTCCLVWAVFLLLQWETTEKPLLLFFSGFLFGLLPTLRYAELLFAMGLMVFLIWVYREKGFHPSRFLWAGAGLAIPVIVLLIRNHLAFGAFYRTAYSLLGMEQVFAWSHFKNHFFDYIQTLCSRGIGVFFPLALLGFILLWKTKTQRKIGILLLSLIVPITLLYMAYYWPMKSGGQQGMRFLVPTLPFYFIAGVFFIKWVTDRLSGVYSYLVVIVLLVFQMIMVQGVEYAQLKVLHSQKKALVAITDEIETYIESGALIAAPDRIQQHLNFVDKWRLVDSHYVMNRDRERAFPGHMRFGTSARPGMNPMRQKRKVNNPKQKLDQWADDRNVYLVTTTRRPERIRQELSMPDSFQIIHRFTIDRSFARRAGRSIAAPPGDMPIANAPAMNRMKRPPFRGFITGDDEMNEEMIIVKWIKD
jgi:hypothetical protein